MQFCEQFPSCSRKIIRKVASNNPNPSMLDFYCMQLSRPVRTQLSLKEVAAHSLSLALAFVLERLSRLS